MSSTHRRSPPPRTASVCRLTPPPPTRASTTGQLALLPSWPLILRALALWRARCNSAPTCDFCHAWLNGLAQLQLARSAPSHSCPLSRSISSALGAVTRCCSFRCCSSLPILSLPVLAASPRCHRCRPRCCPRCRLLVLAAILSSSLPSSSHRCSPLVIAAVLAAIRGPRCQSSMPSLPSLLPSALLVCSFARERVCLQARLLASASACERVCLRARLKLRTRLLASASHRSLRVRNALSLAMRFLTSPSTALSRAACRWWRSSFSSS